jgi:hypothetical protein
MRANHSSGRSRAALSRRRANFSLELLLLFPILLAMLVGVVEFGMMLAISEQLAQASREGCRVAAVGGDEEDVVEAVHRTLGEGRLDEAKIEVVMFDEEGRPLHEGEPVAVRVSIPADRAIPDLLAFIGFTIKDETLAGRTVMRKE